MVETLGKSDWRVYYDPAWCDYEFEKGERGYGQKSWFWLDTQCFVYPILYGEYHFLGEWCYVSIHECMVAELYLPCHRRSALSTRKQIVGAEICIFFGSRTQQRHSLDPR